MAEQMTAADAEVYASWWSAPEREGLPRHTEHVAVARVLNELKRLRHDHRLVVGEMEQACANVDRLEREAIARDAEIERLRAEVAALRAGLRGMARRATHHRRWARVAGAQQQRSVTQHKTLLSQLGQAVGVHVGAPSAARYPDFTARIVAAALRHRADLAEVRAEVAALRAAPTDDRHALDDIAEACGARRGDREFLRQGGGATPGVDTAPPDEPAGGPSRGEEPASIRPSVDAASVPCGCQDACYHEAHPGEPQQRACRRVGVPTPTDGGPRGA